ncbi:hypothetical protein [Nocardioides marmorisolisilvae]|uniref:hypothetical protein n=1 Tax=Nocardioides marmorisolisilvae TaxID=1542737 RepID=UPI0011CE04AB|nr:hypothetical protein [Nocardioides marmorisolisilvae]
MTKLEGVEVQAVYPLINVKQVAGHQTSSLPREISSPMSAKSVPVYLPPGRYVLLVYPDTGKWTVLGGWRGMFEIVNSDMARERCLPTALGFDATEADVLKAAQEAPRGPVEQLADVIAVMKDQLSVANGGQ